MGGSGGGDEDVGRWESASADSPGMGGYARIVRRDPLVGREDFEAAFDERKDRQSSGTA